MAVPNHLKVLRRGSEAWNSWRSKNVDKIPVPDLRNADLSHLRLREFHLRSVLLDQCDLREADLSYADLRGASLIRANLTGANLRAVDLSGADLSGANLEEADLSRVNLSEASLSEANFSRANLQRARLSGTQLSSANFQMSVIGGTDFGNLDLSLATGLEQVRHHGPSILSTRTLSLSKGKIPEAFLRGCGLSDWEIELVQLYDPELSQEAVNQILHKTYDLRTRQAAQISPLLISYSQEDHKFVDQLEAQLNQRGLRSWRDIHTATSERLGKAVDRAIGQNPTVFLILSKHSIHSKWLEHEVSKFPVFEKEMGRGVMYLVALDDSWKNSHWPRQVVENLMEYTLLDFSAWEDDSKFGVTFDQLMDELDLFYKG